jgi:hypothetical protein
VVASRGQAFIFSFIAWLASKWASALSHSPKVPASSPR